MSNTPNTNPRTAIHSNKLIDMLEEKLGIDLGMCYKIVITADCTEPLDIALYIGMRGTMDALAVLGEIPVDELQASVRVVTNE